MVVVFIKFTVTVYEGVTSNFQDVSTIDCLSPNAPIVNEYKFACGSIKLNFPKKI